MNTSVAFAALIWISVVGLVLYGAVVLAARLWAPWAEGTENESNGELQREQTMIRIASLSRRAAGGRHQRFGARKNSPSP